MLGRRLLIILILSLLIFDCEALAQSSVHVIDGDSLRIGNKEIRLEGIDAPEYKQMCFDKTGEEYPCGQRATNYMKYLVSLGEVACREISLDRYKRHVSVCYVKGQDINKKMVQAGWAVAYDRYDDSYVKDEEEARKARVGIWQGRFMKPEIWRALHRRR